MAKFCVKLLRKQFFPINLNLRDFSILNSPPKSSLFISGERAEDTFVVVIPHLDFDKRFENMQELSKNINKRKLSFNLNEMKESWDFYKEWNTKKVQVQENISLAGTQIQKLTLDESKQMTKELDHLQSYIKLMREELQQIKKTVWKMEDNVIGQLLKLPNILHPETPGEEEEIFSFNEENIELSFGHLDKGMELQCLGYYNKLTCFLKNKAALFELAVPEMFVDTFLEDDFVRFSNPDFTRSVLAEGVSLEPFNSPELFVLENTEGNNDHLHLCGGASLFPFCGFHAKRSVLKKFLPLKYIAPGRHYTPVTNSLPGLYSVNQSTSVQIFIGTSSDEEMYYEFECCVKKLTNIFCSIGMNFKIVKQPPQFLKSWESLRVSIQVYSPHEKTFVEVGNLSLTDDFISKRLRMYYFDKKDIFLKVVSGTVVNCQALLALCLERSSSDLFVPSAIQGYMLR